MSLMPIGFLAASGTRVGMEPLATLTLSANAGPIIFSNLPQTGYRDLMLVVNATTQNGSGIIYVTFNATYPNAISSTIITGNGSTASSSRWTSNDKIDFVTASSSVPSTIVSHFLNYSNTSTNKTIVSRFSGNFGGSGTTRLYASTLYQTAGITGFQINTQTGSDKFLPGSTFSIYGIKAAA